MRVSPKRIDGADRLPRSRATSDDRIIDQEAIRRGW
jgi:hypothetical protein